MKAEISNDRWVGEITKDVVCHAEELGFYLIGVGISLVCQKSSWWQHEGGR